MVLILLIALIISHLGVGYVIHKDNSRVKDELSDFNDNLESFFTPESGETLSPAVKFMDYATDSLAQKVGTVVQASIRGNLSAQSRVLTKELETSALDENPMLGVLPKNLQKNPLAMMALQSILSKQAGLSQGNNPAGNNHTAQAKFTL